MFDHQLTCLWCACPVQQIFRKDRDQRKSIIQEVCNIFSRLPTTKVRSRTFQVRLAGDATTNVQVGEPSRGHSLVWWGGHVLC